MDHTSDTPLRPEEMTPANLEGASVYGPGESSIGSVSQLLGSGPDARAVVDVGGFLGIGAKQVAIGLDRMEIARGPNGEVHAHTSMTKDELKNLPEHQG